MEAFYRRDAETQSEEIKYKKMHCSALRLGVSAVKIYL